MNMLMDLIDSLSDSGLDVSDGIIFAEMSQDFESSDGSSRYIAIEEK